MFKLRALIYTFLFASLAFGAFVATSSASRFDWSKGWFVYGVALYQPIDVLVTLPNSRQLLFKKKMTFGGGIGKDHVWLELANWMEDWRFEAAYDLLVNSMVTPYLGYVYGTSSRRQDPKDGTGRDLVRDHSAVVGVSIAPIKFLAVYSEYDVFNNTFLLGVRAKLPLWFL